MTAAIVTPNIRELLAQNRGGRLYEQAGAAGLSLSNWLDENHPVDREKEGGLDTFGVMIRESGIITNSDPKNGYWASRFGDFDKQDARSLAPEWLRRTWMKAAVPDPQRRAVRASLYTSQESYLGSILKPWVDNPRLMWDTQIEPAIPLEEFISITLPIEGDAFRSIFMTGSVAQTRLARVSEGAELPRFKLTTSERTVRQYKYGAILEATYEQLRRIPLDLLAMHIQRMAVQAETDKVTDAMDVIVNGDGNSGTAATNYNLTTLDGAAVAGTLTLKGWLAFKLKFANPYQLTTAFAQEATALQMLLLDVGSANIPLVSIQGASGFGSFRTMNPQLRDAVDLGISADAPSLKIVGLDRRFSLAYLTEVGSDISEVIRWAERQTQGLTMSEVNGFMVIDPNANKTLNVNA